MKWHRGNFFSQAKSLKNLCTHSRKQLAEKCRAHGATKKFCCNSALHLPADSPIPVACNLRNRLPGVGIESVCLPLYSPDIRCRNRPANN
jgi:hypothetical protein